ncbi:unnamed protein product [Trichobilharzia regenti]|nr:unnamed protein product [Trichobilharzia regenti]
MNTGPRADTLAVTGKTTKHWPLDGGLTLPDSAWAPGDWTLSDAFARVDARLGWSAIGCLEKCSTFLATLANIMPKLVCYGLGDGVVPEIGPIQPPDFSRVGNIDQVVCHTLRFLTHFVLFLKSAESDIQDVACSEIIKAYLCFLMVNKNADLVAYYTSALHNESLRIQWYSWFSAGE